MLISASLMPGATDVIDVEPVGKVEHLAEAHLLVRLRRGVSADAAHGSPTHDDTRTAELIGTGGDWAARLAGLAATAALPGGPSVAAR